MVASFAKNRGVGKVGVLEKLGSLPPAERLAAVASVIAVAPPAEREGLVLLLVELASKADSLDRGRGAWFGRRRRVLQEATRQGAVGVLARHWKEIPASLRQVALAAGRGCWHEAFGALEPAGCAACGVSLGQLSLDACDPALTRHLPTVLDLGDSRAAAMAGQALLGLALRLTELSDTALLGIDPATPALQPLLDAEFPVWTPEAVQGLLKAVAAGVETYDNHRRKEVLLAALVLLESPRQGIGGLGGRDALLDLAAESDSPAARTLRSVFRRARAPIGRQRAWLWLREWTVAVSCTERIAEAPSLLDHEVVLQLGHLALAPARSRHLGIIPIATRPAPADQTAPGVPQGRRLHPRGVVPDRAVLSALSPTARRHVPRLIESLDANDAARALALDPFLLDPDPIARLNAARVAKGPGVKDFCFDSEGVIARHASLRATGMGIAESGRLRVGDGARRRFASGLRRSPHRAVRAIGAAEHDRITPGGANTLQLLAARRAHTADPGAFADWVRGIVESADPGEVVGALMTCRRIGAVAAVESILLAIIADSLSESSLTIAATGKSRVAATAVACLGELRTPRTESVLGECFRRHPDARVRANAAEALGRMRSARTHSLSLAEVATDEHHRVRASVLRAILTPLPEPKGWGPVRDTHTAETTTAAESLAAMLEDTRPSYRLAAVWVVQRSLRSGLAGGIGRRWDRVAGRVRWLADEDTDPSVRARAVVVTSRLDAAIAGLGPKGFLCGGSGGGTVLRTVSDDGTVLRTVSGAGEQQ